MNSIRSLILPVMMLAASDSFDSRSRITISRGLRRRYENAASVKACIKRRAKNKQARKSRQINRRAFR